MIFENYEPEWLFITFINARAAMFENLPQLRRLHDEFKINTIYSTIPDYQIIPSALKAIRPRLLIAKLDPWITPLNFLESLNGTFLDKLKLQFKFYEHVLPTHIRAHTIRLDQHKGTTTNVLDSILYCIKEVTNLEIIGASFASTGVS